MLVARERDLNRSPHREIAGNECVERKPLRVCMVSYSFYELDNRVMRYAEALVQRGDRVEVLALRHNNFAKQETLNGVHVHRLQDRELNEKGLSSFLGRILSFLSRAMIEVSRNHLREKYDLIHVHSVPDFMVFAAWLPRLLGTPVILDIHDILPEFYSSKFGAKKDSAVFRTLQFLEKISATFSSHVIVANHIWQQRLLSRSIKRGKCTVLINTPDRAIFKRSEMPKKNSGKFVLLYPGTLNWHQGVDLAIRAFARISQLVPHADFRIYGEGRTKAELLALVKELNLENRITVRGSIPLRDVALLMEQSDLGVVPKRKDGFGNEAFSTKIMEFMAMGVPVIVPDTDVDRYYFDDSIVRFFRGGDEEDLSNAMLDMISDPARRKTQAQNATAFIEQNDWDSRKKQYFELVDSLLPKRTTAATS